MRSALADRPARRAARPVGAGGFLLVAAVVLALLAGLLSGCDREVDVAPPRASPQASDAQAGPAQAALDALVSAVRDQDRAGAVTVAAPASRDLLGQVYDNSADLRVADLAMRYVEEAAPLTSEDQTRFGEDAWRGTVQLAYRYEGLDESMASHETSVVFVPRAGGAAIASFGGPDDRSPLWLVERLVVVRTPQSLLAVAAESAGRYPRLVSTALRQVRQVLPRWQGPLLVEVPGTRTQLDGALAAEPGKYDNIAAVTTTADGSLSPGAPVRVFVNPAVFGKLKDRGAQVVMTHEATHVATEATFTSMPTWLLEGFADYVALAGAGVPVNVAAGQVLPRIRTEGLPSDLPSTEDLDPAAPGLGATYEEAWLACRFLAREYGADRLLRFYDKVGAGASTQEAFRSQVGTTQRAFVAGWRADLARLAGVAR